MKIQCDVCNKQEASLFCTADEAALCGACDHRVHHANKLASKHLRFSLHHPSSSNHIPLCDICREKRAFLFCQQDRAILCKDCDFSIHSANEHTLKHDRFLLTGIKLSVAATDASDSLKSSQNSLNNSVSASSSPPPPSNLISNEVGSNNNIVTTSSISEYLIETLPGWQFDDFLDSSAVPFGFTKGDDKFGLIDDGDIEGNMGSFSSENMGIWVPQAPPQIDRQIRLFQDMKEATNINETSRSSRSRDDNFLVPQISPSSIGSKRSRLLW